MQLYVAMTGHLGEHEVDEGGVDSDLQPRLHYGFQVGQFCVEQLLLHLEVTIKQSKPTKQNNEHTFLLTDQCCVTL